MAPQQLEEEDCRVVTEEEALGILGGLGRAVTKEERVDNAEVPLQFKIKINST